MGWSFPKGIEKQNQGRSEQDQGSEAQRHDGQVQQNVQQERDHDVDGKRG